MPFRAIFCISFSFLMTGLWGCEGHQAKQADRKIKVTVNQTVKLDEITQDTIIRANINGRVKAIKVIKGEVDNCKQIEKLAFVFKNRRIDTTLSRSLDVTGDGVPEKIVGHVYVTKDSIFTTRCIYQNNHIINEDTIKDCLNDTYQDSHVVGIDPNLSPLEPWASFLGLLWRVDIYKDTLLMDLSKDEKDTFGIVSILDKKQLSNSQRRAEVKAFQLYLIGFKGAILNCHEEGLMVPEIWYEPKKRFIPIWG